MAELGGTIVPLGERVAAIEAQVVNLENLIIRVESLNKERDEVARRESGAFQTFVADAQRVLADALREYKTGSNEWRDALNDALTKGVQQPEFRSSLESMHTKISANADRVNKLENQNSEDKALAMQLKDKEKEAASAEKDQLATRNWKIGIFVTVVTILINVLFKLWRSGGP